MPISEDKLLRRREAAGWLIRTGTQFHWHNDGYAGFDRLYGEQIAEVACWAHVRRKFFDIHAATGSAIAREALDHIARLYAVEHDVRGRPPDERRRERQARAGPLLDAFRQWLDVIGPKLSRRSDLAVAVRYALTRWAALTRYAGDGRLEIDNNAADDEDADLDVGRGVDPDSLLDPL